VVYVNTSASPAVKHGERWRVVAGSLALVCAAVLVLASSNDSSWNSSPSSLAEKPLGEGAQEEMNRELNALQNAGIHRPVFKTSPSSAQTLSAAPTPILSWKNAGSLPEANVFSHDEDWTPPDSPLRPPLPAAAKTPLMDGVGPTVTHDSESRTTGEGFRIDHTGDDEFHGSTLPVPQPRIANPIPSTGNGPLVLTGADNAARGEGFTIDTSVDDFLHPSPPSSSPETPAAK